MGVWISRGNFISLLYKACAVSLYTILVRKIGGHFVTLFFNMSQNDLKLPNRILLIFSAIHIKSFAFRFATPTRWGQMIDYELTGSYDPQGKGNFPAYLNYWTPENPSNDFPRPAQTNFYNYLGYQTLNYIDGSYWKIKTVSLGYTFPKSLTSKLGVSKLRAYVTANNLFSFAKNHLIQDYDAERGGSAKAPLQRQFIFGLNLDF